MRIKRFSVAQRLFHLFLLICFLMLSASGIARLYIESRFGATLAGLFGGYHGALGVHKFFGIALIVLFVLHVVYIFTAVRRRLLGPDSLLPRVRDIRDVFQHLGWMLGLRHHPAFERWGYWEKFDYWAVFWGLFIIGGTGLMLYDPLATSRILPGWSLNLALWIHRIEALLAMAHVFIIHFLIAHLRRTTFPVDETMVSGSADLALTRHERGDWVARLTREGRLEALTTAPSTFASKVVSYTFGLAAVAIGLILLIGGILNIPNITW